MNVIPQEKELEHVLAFFAEIGLPAVVRSGATGFVAGIEIVAGVIHVDPSARASGLLHEGGHVATVPGRFRHLFNGNVGNGHRLMFAELEKMDLEPDSPLERACLGASDPEATAWAWAAGTAIGLPPERIIRDDEYDGGGADIRLFLQMNSYAGINGMQQGGMCKIRSMHGEPTYPRMLKWLQAE